MGKIYDNSNLAESYSGATSPLTYSFAQYVYQEVYKHFCAMMGVSKKEIEKNKDIFPNMVEHIGYHMYYNLGNWYTLISLLPGYKFNKPFFEKMLGVEKESDVVLVELPPNVLYRYFVFLPKLFFQAVTILISFVFMGHHVRFFNTYFDKTFKKIKDIPLGELDLPGLQALYVELCTSLIRRWKVPIANDLAVMISTGVAGKLYALWVHQGEMHSYLRLGSHQNLVSLDPGFELQGIALAVDADPKVREFFLSDVEAQEVLRKLKAEFLNHEVTTRIFAYLEMFGSRSPNELKLEAESLSERPETIIKLLRMKIRSVGSRVENKEGHSFSPQIPREIGVMRHFVLERALGWARNSIQRREDTRFRRALIFGYARKIFLAAGSILEGAGILEKQRDIFYLHVDEIFSEHARNGRTARSLVNQRVDEFEKWKAVEMPRRIETNDSIHEIEFGLLRNERNARREEIKISRGLVVARTDERCISGEALVLREFDPDADFCGKILITRQTDPGWTIVFPLLKGIVVERGGMLSHAAIVARELGIPCVVGVQRATEFFHTGMSVVLDMETGEIMLKKD